MMLPRFTLFLLMVCAASAADPADMLAEIFAGSDFNRCVETVEKEILPKRGLSDTERVMYGECLFQTGQYRQSMEQYSRLLNSIHSLRSANRLVDIYKLEEAGVPLDQLIDFLISNENTGFINIQLQQALIERGEFRRFLKAFRREQMQLNNQQWSLLQSGLTEEEFNQLLELAKITRDRKAIQLAGFHNAHGNTDRALQILDELIGRYHGTEAFLLKTSILWAKGKKEEAFKTLDTMAATGPNGMREKAEFLFSNREEKKALQTIRDGIAKGFPFQDQEVFYLMSMGSLRESAALLEIYNKEGLIQPYRYSGLKQEFLKEAGARKYHEGVLDARKKYPELCVRGLEIFTEFARPEEMSAEVKGCDEIRKPFVWREFLFSLLNRGKYDHLEKLFRDKPPGDSLDRYILAKTLMLAGRDPQRGLREVALLEKDPAFPYKNEIPYLRGRLHYQNGEFTAAEKNFASVSFEDSPLQLMRSQIASRSWDRLRVTCDSNLLAKLPLEKKFCSAVWSVSQKQYKQAETLLEEYLNDASANGNRAVYLLFMLKYFPRSDKSGLLMNILLAYPDGVKDEDWKPLKESLRGDKPDETDIFIRYWHSRYLLLAGRRDEAMKELKSAAASGKAELLQEEISYLILQAGRPDEKEMKDYLNRFPASPFRIFMRKDGSQ